jgi:phospholipid transport system substrate-binding protein
MEGVMGAGHRYQVVFFLLITFGIAAPAKAEGPIAKIKETTDKILSLVSDPALKDPDRAEERKTLIRRAVDERFDWEEMSRRSLARHWRQRTDEEKEEFVRLFGQLLERTYMDKLEGYSGEQVIYEREVIDGDYGLVHMKVFSSSNREIPLKYRLRNKEGDWLVYDISIEGVSLVKNYRVQFNNIISRYSYEKLLEKLRAKLAKE